MSSALISATGALPTTHTSSALILPSSSRAVTASADPDFNRMAVRVASPQNSAVSAVIPVVNRMAAATRNILIRSADERDALIARASAEQSRREESDRLHEAQRQADAKLISELRASLATLQEKSEEQEQEIAALKAWQQQVIAIPKEKVVSQTGISHFARAFGQNLRTPPCTSVIVYKW